MLANGRDLPPCQVLKTLQGHISSVRALSSSPSCHGNCRLLFSGGARASLKAWLVPGVCLCARIILYASVYLNIMHIAGALNLRWQGLQSVLGKTHEIKTKRVGCCTVEPLLKDTPGIRTLYQLPKVSTIDQEVPLHA